MNRNLHTFLYLMKKLFLSLSVSHNLKNLKMSFRKLPILPKLSNINKCWFLRQFLWKIFSFDPTVYCLWVLWLSESCVQYHNILNSKYCDIIHKTPTIIKPQTVCCRIKTKDFSKELSQKPTFVAFAKKFRFLAKLGVFRSSFFHSCLTKVNWLKKYRTKTLSRTKKKNTFHI